MINCALLLILVATPAFAALNHPAKITNANANTLSHKALAQHTLEHEQLVTLPMFLNKKDCWKKRPVAMSQLAVKVYKLNLTNPGAGMGVEDQKGYGTVMKDGFYEVSCIKDYMYHHGDADGPNKHEYEIGSSSNVSIVHYNMLVPKEDREAMTSEVCFEFCRTVPDMIFFGLTAGRECYCEPYFKPMAGDSSACDAVCEGDSTTMCGGMAKSSVFQMHFCDSTAGDLASVKDKVEAFLEEANKVSEGALEDAELLQSVAEAGQATFGTAGDTVMSDLMQSAKVFAGEFQHAAEGADKKAKDLKAVVEGAPGGDADFTDPATMKEAEVAMQTMEEQLGALEDDKAKVMDLHELARGIEFSKNEKGNDHLPDVEGEPLNQYMSVMYFVDREYEAVPSTCGGETLDKPMLAKDKHECANTCALAGIACAGFSYVSTEASKSKICFLFSKFKSVTYYTECGKGFLQKQSSFLQKNATQVLQKGNSDKKSAQEPEEKKVDMEETMCYAKLSSFVGTTLKPDPSGKCDLCLKTADKAQRCFE